MALLRVLRSRPPVDYKLMHNGDFESEKQLNKSVSVLPGIFSVDRIITRRDSPNVSTLGINTEFDFGHSCIFTRAYNNNNVIFLM